MDDVCKCGHVMVWHTPDCEDCMCEAFTWPETQKTPDDAFDGGSVIYERP